MSETMSEPSEKSVVLRFVVVAEVIVAVDASKLTKCEVEDAKMPDCAQIGEVVAAVRTL